MEAKGQDEERRAGGEAARAGSSQGGAVRSHAWATGRAYGDGRDGRGGGGGGRGGGSLEEEEEAGEEIGEREESGVVCRRGF